MQSTIRVIPFGAIVLLCGCAGSVRNTVAAPVTPQLSSSDASLSARAPQPDVPSEFNPSFPPATHPDGASDTLWTIESGSYAGLRIPLNISSALGGKGNRGRDHFWRVAPDARFDGGIVGWKSTRYPIPLAFRHGPRFRAITAADSAAFWTIISGMNADFGIDLFSPVTVTTGDPIDVIVVDLGVMREADGLSRVTWAPSGELFDVRVTFHDALVLHDPHVVVHEMMHALGFGHTPAWRSVVNSQDGNRSDRVTPEDVAYAQLAMRSRVKREWADTRHLIALAVARESSRVGDEGNGACDLDSGDPLVTEERVRVRAYQPSGLLTVACEFYLR